MDRPEVSGARPLTRELRWTFVVVGFLLLAAAVETFFRSDTTDEHFAWTIQPSLTAAFMGGGYFASVLLVWVAARERAWANARVALPVAIIFSYLTLAATLIHFERFHEDRAITWAWVTIYVGVPTLQTVFVVLQLRVPGVDPPRTAPFARWALVLAATQAVVMIAAGIALFIAPTDADGLWPWSLTPLTGRVVGAWLIGLGLTYAHGAIEADWRRNRPMLAAGALFAALQFVNIARYSDTIDWGSPSAWAYVVGLVIALGLGLEGVRRARTAQSNEYRVVVSGKAG